eukprot:2812240-Pyramimonas_sp.AAC.1
MAWILSKESYLYEKDELKKLHVIGLRPAESRKESRMEATADFATPSRSPVWKSLGDGARLLDPALEEANWGALWFYSGERDDNDLWVFEIWATLIPALAKLWMKPFRRVRGWPYRILGLASRDARHRRRVETEWGRFACRH